MYYSLTQVDDHPTSLKFKVLGVPMMNQFYNRPFRITAGTFNRSMTTTYVVINKYVLKILGKQSIGLTITIHF